MQVPAAANMWQAHYLYSAEVKLTSANVVSSMALLVPAVAELFAFLHHVATVTQEGWRGRKPRHVHYSH